MISSMSPLLLLIIPLLFTLSPNPVTSELVLDFGYSVSTVADFSKPPSNIHPFALLLRHRSGDALLLDSTNSVFYSLVIPISQENGASLFSGKGVPGFSDGNKTAAMFDRPRSFAVDGRDNVYVADRIHHAIRKISPSGVTTTIAGGYSKKPGRIDGPAQNASFSEDFDLVYVPTLCALLISDRGNRLIRQLDLKPEDCMQKTQAGLGVVPVSGIAVLSLLVGLVFGFVARPYFGTREISSNPSINKKTWKHYRANLGSLALTTYSAIRSGVANSPFTHLILQLVSLALCYISVVFKNIRLEKRVQYDCRKKTTLKEHEPVSLLELDAGEQQNFADQLQDLISFNEGIGALETDGSFEQKHEDGDASEENRGKIDEMINANLLDLSSRREDRRSSLVHRKMIRG